MVLHVDQSVFVVSIAKLICPGCLVDKKGASVRCTESYEGGASSSQAWGAKRSLGHLVVTNLEVLDDIRSHVRGIQ